MNPPAAFAAFPIGIASKGVTGKYVRQLLQKIQALVLMMVQPIVADRRPTPRGDSAGAVGAAATIRAVQRKILADQADARVAARVDVGRAAEVRIKARRRLMARAIEVPTQALVRAVGEAMDPAAVVLRDVGPMPQVIVDGLTQPAAASMARDVAVVAVAVPKVLLERLALLDRVR